MSEKKRILTGDRTTGKLHLGHYVGSLQNRVRLQDEYESFILLADIQALTTHFEHPELLEHSIYEVAMDNLSVGLDPNKITLVQQSRIPSIGELTVFYSMLVSVNSLRHNPTIKTEAANYGYNDMTYGFLGYPVSQSADITFCKANLVPVGEDQKQHVELTRNIAKRFNGIYGDVFKLPEPYIPKVGARIMSLANPEAKMSKSENDDPGRVCLMDKPEDIMRLFKRAITDCESEVRCDPEHKKGVSNLMTIYSAATGRTFAEIEAEFAGRGYGDFKKTVGEAVVELLRPIREESQRLLADKAYLQSVCESGAQKAAYVAEKTLRKVYKKVGFVAR